MLINFELQQSDIRRIKNDILKDIKEVIKIEIENEDIDVLISRKIDKSIEKEFDKLRQDIQLLIKEEIKILNKN